MYSEDSICPVFIYMNIGKCCGCEACVQVCPENALYMCENSRGFKYPILEQEKCIKCNKCVQVCPIYNILPVFNELEQYYGVSHLETEVLIHSASGGVFTFLYRNFKARFSNKGYVAGAVYTEDFKSIQHIIGYEESDFQRMRGSKYFQSDKHNIYNLTKQRLEEGKAVFFSGTPCEVAALQRVLNKHYENLWTMDFICKGCSTPRMLQDYVSYLEKKMKSPITDLNMRYKWKKLDNWIPQFLYVKFKNGKERRKEFYNTELGICFQLLQRRSCQSCPFREKQHFADFTVGDFHGVENKDYIFNKLGTSVVILNTEKAIRLWGEFNKESLKLRKISKEDVYGKNRNSYLGGEQLYNNLNAYDGVTAVRKSIGIKEKIKMHMPVMLLRKITSWRRKYKK